MKTVTSTTTHTVISINFNADIVNTIQTTIHFMCDTDVEIAGHFKDATPTSTTIYTDYALKLNTSNRTAATIAATTTTTTTSTEDSDLLFISVLFIITRLQLMKGYVIVLE